KQQIKRDAKNLERTGEYFRRAQETEKALPYLKEAARLAEDGEPAVRLAYVYMNRYLYKDAVASIELAFNKGDIEKPLDAKFLLAQAQFHAGQYEQARGTLQ